MSEINRVVNIQERRTSALLEVANKEKGYLWDRINQDELKIQEFEKKINQYEIREQKFKNQFEQQRKDDENRLLEKDDTINGLQAINDEYERYKHSISYKIMQPVRKTWDVLRFWKKH